MFIQLQCCQKCFMHKQFNHNEWVFHDQYCKLDQTIQRKCKLKTLKNAKLPPGIVQELQHYEFGEHEIIDQIVEGQKEKIKPEIQTFQIRYKGVYVFSLGETKAFPDYNLIAKLLLVIKKAQQTEINLLNKEIKIAGFVSMYEFVKMKNGTVSQKNIKLKSITELIPQKEFRRTQVSTSKQKRQTHHPQHSHHQADQKPKKDPNLFEECLFKQRPQNHYVFKLKDGSNALIKPSSAQNVKSMGRGSEKMAGRGSLPKISTEELAAKKRQQKRIRCKKFSNRYSNMTKKSDIINKLIKSEYGRIKEEKYQFLSKESDLKVDEEFSQDFELQQLSDSSDQQQNIFKNGSNFARISCIQLLNQLCKAQERPRKFDQSQQNNLNQIQSTQSIDKKQQQPSNEFDYQYDSGNKLAEYDQIDFNITINSMKDNKMEYSSNNLLEPIKETEDEKWENHSFNSSVANRNKLNEKNNQLNVSKVSDSKENSKKEGKRVHKSLMESQIESQRQGVSELQIIKSQKSSSLSRHEPKNSPSKQDITKQKSQTKVRSQKSSFSQQSQKQNQPSPQKLNKSRFKDSDPPLQTLPLQSTQNKNLSQNITSQLRNSVHHQTQTQQDQICQNEQNEQNKNIELTQPMPFDGSHIVNRFSFQSRYSQTEENNQEGSQKYPWESSERKGAKSDEYEVNKIDGGDEINNDNNNKNQVVLNKSSVNYSGQNSLLYQYFSTNLQNFAQKLFSFKKIKSSNFQTTKPQQSTQVQQFLTSLYPCPKILLQTKNKKKISRIIQNFIDPYLQLVSQSQKQHKQWVELTQTNVCKIFLIQDGQTPKKVQTILWNRFNTTSSKLYLTKPQDEMQTFIEVGQLHKEYHQVLFLFYDHKFELHQLPFQVVSKKLAISQKEKSNRKYSFELSMGDKYVVQSQEAKNQPNHIFIAFQAKDGVQASNQQQTSQVQSKHKASNIDRQTELQIKIQVYQKQKGQQNPSEQGLIGTIEKKGKFFFQLNLEKGAYKFEITMTNIDFARGQGKKNVELLFYSEAEVKTSHVKELFE